MLTILRKEGLQVGDIFRWRNPFYGDDKFNVPDKLHFIAGDRPAIVTRITKDRVTFFPFRSKIHANGQIHLIRTTDFNDGLKDDTNAIVPEKHEVSHDEFMEMVDYYIGSIPKTGLNEITDGLQNYVYTIDIPSKVVKTKTMCLRPGKIIGINGKEYLVMNINGKYINIIPFIKLTYLEATRQGYTLQFGKADDVTYQYLNYSEYKAIQVKNSIEVLDYIDDDYIPMIFNELITFLMREISITNGTMFKDAFEQIRSIIDSVSGNYQIKKEVKPLNVDIDTEEINEEDLNEELPVYPDETPKEPTTFQAVKSSQLSALEQLKNDLAIKEALKNQELKDQVQHPYVPHTVEEEMEELHRIKLDTYFIPTNKSKYLREIENSDDLLNAIRETSGSFTIRTGKSEAVFNYRKKLILESIVKCKAPFIIKKYI